MKKDMDAKKELIKASRNWMRECNIQMSITSNEKVADKLSNKIYRVGRAIEILDPNHEVKIDPEFDVTLVWMSLTKFPWVRAYDFLRDAVMELYAFRFEGYKIMVPVRGLKKL